jgi:NADH-quinone oxidoreductase subunit L
MEHGTGAASWPLLAVVLGAPLFGAFFNGVFGKRLGKPAVRIMALTVMAVSFAAAVATFLKLRTLHHHAHLAALDAWKSAHGGSTELPQEIQQAPSKLVWHAWHWFSMATSGGDGRMAVDIKFSVDELSAVMMLVVTGVGFLIHLYSSSYMAKDPGYHRFFAYLNLFVFSMLTLVLADNLPVLFVGWEGVGACSYLLIGFWFDVSANASAGRKAFIANRIGDVGVIAGMLIIGYYVGALDWDGINSGVEKLVGDNARLTLWTTAKGAFTISAATAACLALFLGCTGKSAQIPLYVWLPDAMAGPTPVSALIHAATMVTSGIYLICRLNNVFAFSPFTMMIVAIVGALTALFAATIGLVQNDIKKVLAYSTVSQLGFMFLGVGVGAFGMGFFHVFTHAFFKACLFLGAGSVIHAMHARIHDDVKSQDMRNMGGLRRYMPWTYASMGVATAAIAGLPLTSGFFSKDGILFKVAANEVVHPYAATARSELASPRCAGAAAANCQAFAAKAHAYFEAPKWLGTLLFVIGIVAATCTAFYMFRLLFKTFWGDFRGWAIDPNGHLATNPFENEEPLEVGDTSYRGTTHVAHDPGAHHEAHDAHGGAEHDHDPHHDHHHDEDLTVPAAAPHEAPWTMALPVAILAVFAAFAGFLYAEPIKLEPLGHWLSPVFGQVVGSSVLLKETFEKNHALEYVLILPGVLAFVVGSGLAYLWYVQKEGKPAEEFATAWPRLHRAAYNKWYVDEAYDATIVGGTDALADGAALMDVWIVDGILAKLSALLVSAFGALLRTFQTGVVHVYGGILAIGTLAVFGFFLKPHADANIGKQADTFVLEAAPGLGYEYRWSIEGEGAAGEFEAGDGALKRTVQVPLDSTKKVVLEVKNAFGRTSSSTFTLTNPKPPPVPSVRGLGAAGRPAAPPPGIPGH